MRKSGAATGPRAAGAARPSEPAPPTRSRRRRIRLGPPAGTEAALHEIAGEELLVLRVPLRTIEPPHGLSKAENEVASLVLLGLSNADIAHRRGTRPRTVANQVAAIFLKLGVRSRVELARRLVDGARS